jgi:hypothetical protein
MPLSLGRRQQTVAMVAFVAGSLALVVLCVALRHLGVRLP